MKKTLILITCLVAFQSYGQWQYVNPTSLGSSTGSYLWQTGVIGTTGGNNFYNNSWLYRTSTLSGWTSTRLIDGISIDASFQAPTVARSWWSRDAYNNIQSWGDMGNTYLTINQGNIGIGTSIPAAKLDVGSDVSNGALGTVFGRLPEGNGSGAGTFLGVRGYGTQPADVKSFALEHSFFGSINSSINFHRGGSTTGGFMTLNTNSNIERVRITTDGNVGIGTGSPEGLLHIGSSNLGVGIVKRLVLEPPYHTGAAWQFTVRDDAANSYLGIGYGAENLTIHHAGNIGIGTTAPDAKLAVKGTVHAQEVKVDLAVPGPDYVFNSDYNLLTLEEIKTYIDKNKRLPEVPSAKEMEANGMQLGEMNMLLLKKIEELTLYQIQSLERIQILENEITVLKKK